MTTFLTAMSDFAQADIFNGELIVEMYFHLKQIPAINAQFEFFGVGNMLFLANLGSYFII